MPDTPEWPLFLAMDCSASHLCDESADMLEKWARAERRGDACSVRIGEHKYGFFLGVPPLIEGDTEEDEAASATWQSATESIRAIWRLARAKGATLVLLDQDGEVHPELEQHHLE